MHIVLKSRNWKSHNWKTRYTLKSPEELTTWPSSNLSSGHLFGLRSETRQNLSEHGICQIFEMRKPPTLKESRRLDPPTPLLLCADHEKQNIYISFVILRVLRFIWADGKRQQQKEGTNPGLKNSLKRKYGRRRRGKKSNKTWQWIKNMSFVIAVISRQS